MKSQMQLAIEALEKIKTLSESDLKRALISSGMVEPSHPTFEIKSFSFGNSSLADEHNLHEVMQFKYSTAGSNVYLSIGFA